MRKPGVVTHTCNCRTPEAENRVAVSSSQPELHHEFHAKLGYKTKPCLNKTR